MTEIPPTPANTPTKRLDDQGVLKAIVGLCGLDRATATLLLKGFRRLIASDDWSGEIVRLERVGLSAKHYTGPFRDALDIPGDIILLRNTESGFTLLNRMEHRWLYLGEDGAPLSEEVDIAGDNSIEAVVMKMPQVGNKHEGFASLAALWPELRAAWAEVGLSSLYINVGQLLLPMFAMLVYDKIAPNGLYESLWSLVFGMGIYMATVTGMRLMRSWAAERISVDMTLQVDEKLWSKLAAQVDLPPGGFPRFLHNYRDLTLSRDFVSSSYLLSIADMPFFLLYLAFVGLIAWQLMIVAIILVLLYSGLGLMLQARQVRLFKESENNNTNKLSYMGEVLGCLDVVRTSPESGTFLRRWRNLAEKATFCETKRRLATVHVGMLAMTIQTLTTVIVLTVGVYLIQARLLTTGQLIACNILTSRAMAMVTSLFAVTVKWQDFTRAAERMKTSLEDVVEHECTPKPNITGNISVIGIGKHYEGRPAALETVSFAIAPGERIALLGRPGAGKSTLLRCLSGLCRPDTGQVLIDGLDLDAISRFDRGKWMSYKAQDPAVFAGTLDENLQISGCKEIERYNAAIWASGLDNEFNSGRMSLGMQLEERGNNLSGGQRQKVALARVFAQPSRIMLLDEPTLGLDPESERMLAERLPKLLDDSDVLIMTTHSPVMLRTVQRIIALDGGKVVADGPREKLVTLPA